MEDRDEEVEDEFDHVLPVLEGNEDVEDGEIELELPRVDVLRELELPVLLAPLALLDWLILPEPLLLLLDTLPLELNPLLLVLPELLL